METGQRPQAGAARGEEFLLLTSKERPGPSVVTVVLTVGLLAGFVLLIWRTRHFDGAGRAFVHIGGTVTAIIALWILAGHLELLARWWRWRRRAVPAMLISRDGLRYSAAFDETFPLTIGWDQIMGSDFRPASDGHPFWCVDVQPVAFSHAIPPDAWMPPVDPAHAWTLARELADAVEADGYSVDFLLLTNLLTFGTPVAINLHHVHNVALDELDNKLRQWSQGRCTIRPDPDPTPGP